MSAANWNTPLISDSDIDFVQRLNILPEKPKKVLHSKSASGIDRASRSERMTVKSPVDLFREDVRRLPVGTSHLYHVGNLQEDRQTSPSLANIAMMAFGLSLIGKVTLSAKSVWKDSKSKKTGEVKRVKVWNEYFLKVLQPINPIDFDRARKAWLESLKEEN